MTRVDFKKISLILFAIGAAIILMGALVLSSGFDQKRAFGDDAAVDVPQRIYFFRMDALAGEPITAIYSLSNGSMTVAIFSQTGYDELISTGLPTMPDIFLEEHKKTDGSLSWTPYSSQTYYLCFYSYDCDNGTLLHCEGSYYGTNVIFMGLGGVVMAIGAVVIILGFIMRKKTALEPVRPVK
jgi:hypothetical protein